MSIVLVVAPHPDDETLGCGGTLLKHKYDFHDEIHWLIVTKMFRRCGFSSAQIERSKRERETVAKMYGFSSLHSLNFPTARLDAAAMVDIIKAMTNVMEKIQPNVIYLPYPGDIHTDHRIVFNVASACTKCFRYPSVHKVMAYETVSETNFALNPENNGFHPNLFVDIGKYLNKKIAISKVFANEMGTFPFPRSEKAIRALAAYRGTAAGRVAAEAFMILKAIVI